MSRKPKHSHPVCVDTVPRIQQSATPERAPKRVSAAYKVAATAVSLGVTIGVIQNLDTLNRWENARTNSTHMTIPEGCAQYAPPKFNISGFLDPPKKIVSSAAEAKKLRESGEEFEFAPDVSHVRTRVKEFNPGGVQIGTTLEQARNFFDHKIQEFTVSSGLTINIFSSTPDPSFTINPQRFDELFHASLDPKLRVHTSEYRTMLSCTQARMGAPGSMDGKDFDIFILPEPGYCLDNMRYFKVPAGSDYDCVAAAGTPPRMLLEFLHWNPLDEEFMILSTTVGQHDPEAASASIDRMLVHESAHYWKNQLQGKTELQPEEQYVETLEQTIFALNIADANNPLKRAIQYTAA